MLYRRKIWVCEARVVWGLPVLCTRRVCTHRQLPERSRIPACKRCTRGLFGCLIQELRHDCILHCRTHIYVYYVRCGGYSCMRDATRGLRHACTVVRPYVTCTLDLTCTRALLYMWLHARKSDTELTLMFSPIVASPPL